MNNRRYSKFLAGIIASLIIFSLFISPALAAAGDATRVSLASDGAQGNNEAGEPSISTAMNSSPVMFIENTGQFGDGARFQVRGGNGTIWLAEDALWVTVLEQTSPQSRDKIALPPTLIGKEDMGVDRKGVNIKLSFVGANPHPRLEPINLLDSHVSYFTGNDPTKWHADVSAWGGVRYKELYPGIDLEISGENGHLMQRLVTRVGADLGAVQLRVDGVDRVVLDGSLLHFTTAMGEYTLPLLQVSGAGSAKRSSPVITGNQVTSPFVNSLDETAGLTPQSSASNLLYATFLGGSDEDAATSSYRQTSIAVDSTGTAYVFGRTFSTDFPTTPGAFQSSHNGGSYDMFVTKLNPSGSAIVYSTYIGGNGWDFDYGIAVDGSGQVFLTGYTDSTDFPTTPGAYNSVFSGGDDVFITKLNVSGSALIYSTLLGSDGYEWGYGIAVDTAGNTYVVGGTLSANFPVTAGAFDTTFGGGTCNSGSCSDAFVAKLNSSGSALSYATFLGGSNWDEATGIGVDGSGNVYVSGTTQSSDFPAKSGAFDTTFGGGTCFGSPCADAFVAKFNNSGSALAYATFLGGSNRDYAEGIAVDSAGNAYVTGRTMSADFPTTTGAFDRAIGGGTCGYSPNTYPCSDIFVVKMNTSGSMPVYSTFAGGSYYDYGYGIAVDSSGSAVIVGGTGSSDFPTTAGAFNTIFSGGNDAFMGGDVVVIKLSSDGSTLLYGTYLGGWDGDRGEAIALDVGGNAYITGGTMSDDFPTTAGSFDNTYNTDDTFVVKLKPENLVTYSISGRVSDGSSNGIADVSLSDGTGHTALTNSSGNYTLSGLAAGTHTITPSKSGYTFLPASRTVTVPPSATNQDFTLPFLDLPFQYTNFQEAAQGSNGGEGPGYVNSWFDHTSPGYGNADGNLTTWLGPYTGNKNITRENCTTLGESCYDSHDGVDFRHVSDNVLAAASGTVFGIGYEENGFGNYLYIDHHNCYASFYAHLKTAPSLQNGDSVTDRQQIGIMGNTGLSLGGGGGVHLHFGLYYDPTCDGNWSDKIVVDPYGWSGTGLDPWTTGPSRYLWKHAYDFAQQSITSSGGSATTPSGNLAVTVPAGSVVSPITLELWNTPPVAGASATSRSTGNSFWMRVLEWLNRGSSPARMASASTNSFDVPVTVTVYYDPSSMPHLDTSQLTIKQWDDVGLAWVTLPTTLDTVNQQASAQTSQPGHFDLQAPLVCPADTLEPNDNYDGASVAQTDGTLVNNLFDIVQDEDWFKFDAIAGTQYDIQTSTLATGVDTALEIYDTDGVTLLESNDNSGGGNASSLIWQAPQDGLYFARVVQAAGSSFGCSSTYNFAVTTNYTLTIVSANGTVARNPDHVTYHEGDVVQLTATPNVGWSFANWTGDLVSSINPDSVIIHGNTSVTANYTQNEKTLTITSAHVTVV